MSSGWPAAHSQKSSPGGLTGPAFTFAARPMARPAVIAAVARSPLMFMGLSVKRNRHRQNGAGAGNPRLCLRDAVSGADRGLGATEWPVDARGTARYRVA